MREDNCRRNTGTGAIGSLMWLVLAATIALSPGFAIGQDAGGNAELERKIEVLTYEIEKLKTGEAVFEPVGDTQPGFAPAASTVYGSKGGVTLAGYGEMLYQKSLEDGGSDNIDMLRAVFYFGHRFTDKILFNSEIEFEHASTGKAGEASVEQAYIDFLLMDEIGIRAGLLLVPVGFVNELHEPPVYLGSLRPETAKRIIPSTWRENGAGIFGEVGGFAYRAYALNGFDGVGNEKNHVSGFSSSGLRGGRQKGSKARINDISLVARVDYIGLPWLTVGGSAFIGNSGQDVELDGEEIDAMTQIYEGHLDLKYKGVEFRGLFAFATVGDADKINKAKELEGADSVGEQMTGYYVQAGYDVFRPLNSTHRLVPFARFEAVNTQAEVPDGYASSDATDVTIITAGLNYFPVSEVVVKADYSLVKDGGDNETKAINAALGYMF